MEVDRLAVKNTALLPPKESYSAIPLLLCYPSFIYKGFRLRDSYFHPSLSFHCRTVESLCLISSAASSCRRLEIWVSRVSSIAAVFSCLRLELLISILILWKRPSQFIGRNSLTPTGATGSGSCACNSGGDNALSNPRRKSYGVHSPSSSCLLFQVYTKFPRLYYFSVSRIDFASFSFPSPISAII